MIFVVLGTQDKKFERLLQEVEQLIIDGTIQKKVIVQAGTTTYKSKYMEIHKMIPMKQFLTYMDESDYIITHGGVGTILDAMKKNKKIIAVPRLKKYGEHENDHQLQIIDKFSQEQYLIGCTDVEDLKEAIQKIEQFEPKTCQLGNEQMLNMITDYIGKTDCHRKNIMLDIFYTMCAFVLEALLYLLFRTKLNMLDAVSLGWLLSYILFLLFRYQKHNYIFEFIWSIFLVFSLILWFNICNDLLAMLGITCIANIITCIGHNLFYKKEKLV